MLYVVSKHILQIAEVYNTHAHTHTHTHTQSKGSTNASDNLDGFNNEHETEPCTNSQKQVQLQSIYSWWNALHRQSQRHPDASDSYHSPSPLILFLIKISPPLPLPSCISHPISLSSFFLPSCSTFPLRVHTCTMHSLTRVCLCVYVCVLCDCAAEKTYGLPLHKHPSDRARRACRCVCVSFIVLIKFFCVCVCVLQCVFMIFKDVFVMVCTCVGVCVCVCVWCVCVKCGCVGASASRVT